MHKIIILLKKKNIILYVFFFIYLLINSNEIKKLSLGIHLKLGLN